MRRSVSAGLGTTLTLLLPGQAHAAGGFAAASTTVTVLEDPPPFGVTYRDFVAQAGGDSRPTDFRRNCQINLQIHVPQGFTFAIAGADY